MLKIADLYSLEVFVKLLFFQSKKKKETKVQSTKMSCEKKIGFTSNIF